jgi:hypothetical protein
MLASVGPFNKASVPSTQDDARAYVIDNTTESAVSQIQLTTGRSLSSLFDY